jgi:hypothetical protein
MDWGPNDVIGAAQYWSARIGEGLAGERFLGPARVLSLRYEDLLRVPAAELQKVSQFLDLPVPLGSLSASAVKLPAYNQTIHRLVGGSLDVSRISAWNKVLSARQIEIFEAESGDLLEYLGYQLVYGRQARKATGSERIRLGTYNLLRKVPNWFRFRRRLRAPVS